VGVEGKLVPPPDMGVRWPLIRGKLNVMKVPPYPPKRTPRTVTGPYLARNLHRLFKNGTKNRSKRDEKCRLAAADGASSGFLTTSV
jgi:hypothetical protein